MILGEFGSKLATASDQQWFDKMTAYLAGDLDGNGTKDLAAGQQGISHPISLWPVPQEVAQASWATTRNERYPWQP